MGKANPLGPQEKLALPVELYRMSDEIITTPLTFALAGYLLCLLMLQR